MHRIARMEPCFCRVGIMTIIALYMLVCRQVYPVFLLWREHMKTAVASYIVPVRLLEDRLNTGGGTVHAWWVGLSGASVRMALQAEVWIVQFSEEHGFL